MSFKIFTLQLLGKLKTVEFVEKQRKNLLDDYNEFLKVEKSDELKRFLDLEKEVNSEEFKKRKAELDALQFKGSKEFNQLNEFQNLQKKKTLKNYFKIANSSDLEKYNRLKSSEKLEEYYKLKEYVKEGQFLKDKKEIESQVFKGSVEEKHWIDFKKVEKSEGVKAFNELDNSEKIKRHELFGKSEKLHNFVQLGNVPDKDKQKKQEYKQLKNDREIRAYFKFEKSKKLRLYKEMANSHLLVEYRDLKTYVQSDAFKKQEIFLKDKRKFVNSDANRKFLRFKQLGSDPDIRFFLNFEKSAHFKNYVDVVDSFDLNRFHELDEIIKSKQFIERKNYLEDKKKWEKTDEFARLQEYTGLKKQPQLVKYFSYKNTSVFKFLEEWEIVFEDDFLKPQLDTEKWSTNGYIAGKLLGDNYSVEGDNHIFTDGKNISVNGNLKIEVRKEKTTGKIWKTNAGFIPGELDYSTGLISSWKSFWMEDGIFEAKIKFNPVPQIVSSFYLAGEQEMPRLNILEMGARNRLGIMNIGSDKKANVIGLDISNLKKGRWYIFTVEKKGAQITWKINESVVLSLQNPELNHKLQLNASSIVVKDIPADKLPGRFEIDWIKCYRKN